MTKEELEKEAVKRVDAFIDNFSQDVRSTLYDRLNQEDVKDFLYSLYIDSAEPREKRIEELKKENEDAQYINMKVMDENSRLEKENAELKNRNQELLESCEGATMMYKDLCKAKELIKTLLLIADNKVSQMEFQLCVAEAEQFISEVNNALS